MTGAMTRWLWIPLAVGLLSGCCIENGEGCLENADCCSGCCSFEDGPFSGNHCYACAGGAGGAGGAEVRWEPGWSGAAERQLACAMRRVQRR